LSADLQLLSLSYIEKGRDCREPNYMCAFRHIMRAQTAAEERDMPAHGMLAVLAGLVILVPLLTAATPMPQPKGLQTIRFITFNLSSEPPIIAARARGFFAAEGLDMAVTITPNSTDQMRGLGQGTWDIASTAFDNVLAWSGREGVPIVAVLQRHGAVNLPLYVRPEIHDWADLRGRPLAVDAVDTAFALVLRRILLAHELDFERHDYELLPVGARRVGSLERGEAFAAMLSTADESAARAAGLVRLSDYTEVLPNYPDGVYAVTRAWGESHRDLLVRFTRAWLAAARWVHDHPQAAVELVAADQNVDHEVAERAVVGYTPEGELNLPGLQGVLDLRTQFGFTLPMGTELARYYDSATYQAALGR
jgi:ABC-type nitrate/sulfonate/bicarbonate transport system substrate-binding protein